MIQVPSFPAMLSRTIRLGEQIDQGLIVQAAESLAKTANKQLSTLVMHVDENAGALEQIADASACMLLALVEAPERHGTRCTVVTMPSAIHGGNRLSSQGLLDSGARVF